MSTKGYVSRTRGKQVVRVLAIIALMQRGWWSSAGLAKQLGVSPRTIRRDIMALRYAKIHLMKDGIYNRLP
jgi:predicted DNA-binding transcriptional regulator YafY